MPAKEIKAAIVALESQLKHYEYLLDHSISNDEVLAKTKIILHKLKEISQELNDLKKHMPENNQN